MVQAGARPNGPTRTLLNLNDPKNLQIVQSPWIIWVVWKNLVCCVPSESVLTSKSILAFWLVESIQGDVTRWRYKMTSHLRILFIFGFVWQDTFLYEDTFSTTYLVIWAPIVTRIYKSISSRLKHFLYKNFTLDEFRSGAKKGWTVDREVVDLPMPAKIFLLAQETQTRCLRLLSQ